jgi:hypothetical protein
MYTSVSSPVLSFFNRKKASWKTKQMAVMQQQQQEEIKVVYDGKFR